MSWSISLKAPFLGYTKKWFKNSNPTGDARQASAINCIDLTDPYSLKQGKALTNLTNGDTAELIVGMTDYTAKTGGYAYGISATKLWEITSALVTATGGVFPHTITNATAGKSVFLFKNNLYYFYNKSSGSDIGKYDLTSTFTDGWGTATDTTGVFQQGPHPVCEAEGIMFFGNGQYVGTYTGSTLDVNNYDLGAGNEVVSMCYTQGKVFVAVNNPAIAGNKGKARIYVIDAKVLSTEVDDSIYVGGSIGSLFVKNGIIYVFYKVDGDTAYKFGYLNGNSITYLADYENVMPNQNQITTYEEGILFGGGSRIYVVFPANSTVIYPISATTYSTSYGSVASPFGTPLICSAGASNREVAKFDAYKTTGSDWTSVMFDVSTHKTISTLTDMTIETDTLATGAACVISFFINKSGTAYSETFAISPSTGINNIHYKPLGIKDVKDFKIKIDFTTGSSTAVCPIREIIINGESYGGK